MFEVRRCRFEVGRGWNRSRVLQLTLCLAVSAVCLYLALRGMDFARTGEELRKSSPLPVTVAIFFMFVSYWIRAYRWRYLLGPVKSIRVYPLFRSTLIGFMGNFLLPFRAGELMRAVSIGQTQSISKSSALGSILLERVFDGVTLSLTPFFLLAVIELPPWLMRVNLTLLALYVAVVVGLLVAMHRGWAETWIQKVTALLPQGLARRAGSLATDFLHGMKTIRHSGALLPVSLLSLVCWAFHGMYFFFLFRALDLELSFAAALILQMVIGLGVIIPAAPGYVGTFEYFTVVGLALFGIGHETALAYALLARLGEFIPVSAVGLFFALRGGFQPLPLGNKSSKFEVRGLKVES